MELSLVMTIFLVVIFLLATNKSKSKSGMSVRPFCVNTDNNGKCTVRKRFLKIKPMCVQFFALSGCEKQIYPKRPPAPKPFKLN